MTKVMTKSNKKKRGFTLIELIVVIAILGILAAILVPTMIGLIGDSKQKVADANAKSVYTAAKATLTMLVTQGETIEEKTYTVPFIVPEGGTEPEIITQVKANLGTSFTTFSFKVENNDIVEATYGPIATGDKTGKYTAPVAN